MNKDLSYLRKGFEDYLKSILAIVNHPLNTLIERLHKTPLGLGYLSHLNPLIAITSYALISLFGLVTASLFAGLALTLIASLTALAITGLGLFTVGIAMQYLWLLPSVPLFALSSAFWASVDVFVLTYRQIRVMTHTLAEQLSKACRSLTNYFLKRGPNINNNTSSDVPTEISELMTTSSSADVDLTSGLIDAINEDVGQSFTENQRSKTLLPQFENPATQSEHTAIGAYLVKSMLNLKPALFKNG